MLTLIAVLEIGAVVAGAAAFFVIRKLTLSLKAYSEEKGKNLATKEDIAEITRKVESVRAEYAERLQALIHENTLNREATQRRHQLSMAALDKRLEAHQQAYALWRRLAFLEEKDARFEFFQECEKWWVEHCLYLSPKAEDAFWGAFHARYVLFCVRQGPGGRQHDGLWKKIEGAGSVIRTEAQLPGLAPETEKPLSPPDSASTECLK